jgi:sugar phosphate isomerase/epimerase
VRVLFSIDTAKTQLLQPGAKPHVERADNDYALAWTRSYGRGRVVYCTIGHSPRDFMDPRILEFYLGAVQFVMGDLPGSTTPSNRLTPAEEARDRIGWRLGVTAWGLHKFTFFQTLEKTRQLGLNYVGGLSFQKVSKQVPRNLDAQLSDEELAEVRKRMDALGIRMPTFFYAAIPADEAGCRKVFEFGRKLGIETFISEPPPESLDMIERFCDEYDIELAIHNHGPEQSPVYWRPEGILKVCQGRSKRIGACPDTGYWLRSGIDPIQAVRKLGDRVLTIQPHDLNELTAQGHDVPWGTGKARFEELMRELRRLDIQPTLIGLEYSHNYEDNMAEMAQCIEFFNQLDLD